MRHLLFILILLFALFPVHTCGQEALPVGMPETAASDALAASYGLAARKEKPAYKQTVYWKRYKALKITGWSSLAVGIPAIGIGFLGGYVDDSPSKWSDVKPGWKALFYSGIGLTVISFPLLATASVCKRKAYNVSLGADCIVTPVMVGGERKEVQPALALRLHF